LVILCTVNGDRLILLVQITSHFSDPQCGVHPRPSQRKRVVSGSFRTLVPCQTYRLLQISVHMSISIRNITVYWEW